MYSTRWTCRNNAAIRSTEFDFRAVSGPGSKGCINRSGLAHSFPCDSGENAINPKAGIMKISKQISERYPFTINADQTEIHFTLNQNRYLNPSGSMPRVAPNESSGHGRP
jgi:hypothetical protein